MRLKCPGDRAMLVERGTIDDRKEVDRQSVRRRTPISLEDLRTICGAYRTGVLNFESIVSKIVRVKSAPEEADFCRT